MKYSKDIQISLNNSECYIRVYKKRKGVWYWGKTYTIKINSCSDNRISYLLSKYISSCNNHQAYIKGRYSTCNNYKLELSRG